MNGIFFLSPQGLASDPVAHENFIAITLKILSPAESLVSDSAVVKYLIQARSFFVSTGFRLELRGNEKFEAKDIPDTHEVPSLTKIPSQIRSRFNHKDHIRLIIVQENL